MSAQTLPQRAATVLADKLTAVPSYRVTIGLDGFVDAIIRVVDKRESHEQFTPLSTIAAFGERISRAAGMSTQMELWVERVKLGGNGPIMANAMAATGVRTTYVGTVGYPHIHPAFEELTNRATVLSIADPGFTDALEFDDGKLMLGKRKSVLDVTWSNLLNRVGRDQLMALFRDSNLIGLQNWTMLPYMSDIWQHVLDDICPTLPAAPRRTFFFDLADPESRDPKDIRLALGLVTRFQNHFDTYLGLNEKEAFEIGHVLGYTGPKEVTDIARFVWEKLEIDGVVVHPRAYAVTASATGVVKVNGPFVEKPLISTGAGDHFNAGFCLGKLIGADNEIALQIGVGTSGYYVRTAKSPTASELVEFLRNL